MLRTVWRSGRFIRLRSPTASLAAPCCSKLASWPFIHAPTPRRFSVAPETIVSLESIQDDDRAAKITVITEESSEKKKSKKKKRIKRPSKTKARKLFEHVAPHIPLKTLNAITRKLKQSAPKVKAETRVGQVHDLLESAKMDPWTKQRFSEFFLVKGFVKIKDNESFPPNVNKASLETYIDILERARDLSVQRPLLWSLKQRRKETKSKKAAAAESESTSVVERENDNTSKEGTLTIHNAKSKETRRQEAQELAVLLAEQLPEKAFKNVMNLFTSYVEQTANPQKPKLRMLFTHLNKCVLFTHVHLVADHVASFFYVRHFNTDPRLRQREKEWNAEQDKFVETILEVFDSLGSDVSGRRNLHGKNAETLGELDKLRTRPCDGVKVGRDRQTEQAKGGRRRKNVHVVFDAMLLQDEWNPPTQQQYIVFVDNLPIDMDETDLFDLYSRCGQVQSVQIFNQREELDPGPLTAKKKREHKTKQRQNPSRNRRHWKRPRTPVYGQITFTSEVGYNAAVDAPLRIFGMVVRKHPMRSIRATDMTSLYLEDIPQGMYSLDIEHKLSQLLHPEIYVCLDVGQYDFAEPSSCEIKFLSFEMAHHAYHKLQELDIEGSSLQWMRTPEDAMKYWTREYSFET